ncbi:MAG: VWA domain-containing protein [Hyphomicrobiales bacterium]|nr:MAG: VWA domain-containing protein [Hyphomicrobiales bacterium]
MHLTAVADRTQEASDRREAAHEGALGRGAAEAFPGDLHPAWIRACRRLSGAGYGEAVTQAYIHFSPEIAGLVSPQSAIDLAGVVSGLAIRAGRVAAALLPETAITVAGKFGGRDFARWLSLVEYAKDHAPESLAPILQRTAQLVSELDLEGLESWLRIGIRMAEGNAKRRLRFFNLEDPAGKLWLQRASGETGFAEMEARLRPFLTALWGDHPPLRETPANAPEQARRRAGFDGSVVRLPSSFPGFSAHDAETLYRAASAHIAAHLKFSRERFPVGGLKPTQIALVSLIEDARVERLAMRELPGLARLFLPFHTIRPSATLMAPALLARLARALADPSYEDPDAWVQKGRKLFDDAEPEWHSQKISRRIGDLLGNDLGQMRVRFDPKTYVVQPPYRDDNMGLWDFGDDDQLGEDAEQVLSTARIRQEENEELPDRIEPEQKPDGDASKMRVSEQSADGVLVARYPEFDYVTGREQSGWTSVKEYQATLGSEERVARLREQRADLASRLTALIRSARVSRAERLRRQPEGEFLDIDACIDASIARRMGELPSPHIHGRYERRSRDLSVLLLLDVSQSTSDRVRDGRQTVLDVERQAAALLSQAMSGLGDPFSLAAFCSDRREDVRYTRIKDFSQPYDALVEARLAGLQSGFSTRLGAAIRHAGAELAGQRSYRRLLLVVTDGEPSDIDVEDRRYLVEDAQRAVQGLGKLGINTFCVGLDSNADSYLGRIFGQRNAITIASVERLTDLLPKLYLMLGR